MKLLIFITKKLCPRWRRTCCLLANIEPSLTMQCFSVFIALHKVISTCCGPSTPPSPLPHYHYKPLFTLVPIPDLVHINWCSLLVSSPFDAGAVLVSCVTKHVLVLQLSVAPQGRRWNLLLRVRWEMLVSSAFWCFRSWWAVFSGILQRWLHF